MALSQSHESATLLAFPRLALRARLGAALKQHRVPELLAASLLREAGAAEGESAEAALGAILARRIACAPINLDMARGILLLGPSGAGKSAVATKIARAAALAGRKTVTTRADTALGLFRTGTHPANLLTVMEADGFNPLNLRAASAFSALGDVPGVETIGIVSALSDAEDAADLVAAFRFRRVIVTNLDRTRRLGAVVAALTNGAGLAHVTRGPRAEDALENLTPALLAEQLLHTQTH